MYILILFAHVGMLGNGNSNALSMHEFSTKNSCEAAGQAAKTLADSSVKIITFKCVLK